MTVRLPRLKSSLPIVDGQGMMTNAFLRALNEVIAAAESQIGALAAAQAAETAAAAANAAADAANAAAESVTDTTSLANSYATGLTVTAVDAGTDATINISAHTRVYGDGTSVSVNAGSVTGRAYSTDYWVYYDQPSRAGGTVTYLTATTIQGNGVGNPDRHFVGAVRTPAGGGGPVDGNPVLPPGANLP